MQQEERPNSKCSSVCGPLTNALLAKASLRPRPDPRGRGSDGATSANTPAHLLISLMPEDPLKAAVEHFSCGQPKAGQCGPNKETSHVETDLVKTRNSENN